MTLRRGRHGGGVRGDTAGASGVTAGMRDRGRDGSVRARFAKLSIFEDTDTDTDTDTG